MASSSLKVLVGHFLVDHIYNDILEAEEGEVRDNKVGGCVLEILRQGNGTTSSGLTSHIRYFGVSKGGGAYHNLVV